MQDLEKLFNDESISTISNIVEEKMHLLKNISNFNDKEKSLAMNLEIFEKDLSTELKEKFDTVMKLTYQIEEYYFTLAYFMGMQSGKTYEKL